MSYNNNSVPKIDVDAVALYDKPNQTGTPERNLLLAVLERAILDYVGNEKKEIERAEKWLFGEAVNEDSKDEPRTSSFSFSWVCQQLDLDPFKVSNIIKAMPKRGNRRVAPWYFNNTQCAA